MQFIFKVMLVFIVAILSACERHEEKALIADENWTQGQLENGLRYHIYPTNDEEVSVRMLVHVGSLQENDNQKGYAHFVEHMAFNGTRNFSGNDIIQLVEKSGKSFGRDINAFTAYQLTHYQLDLASEADLTMALTWMRDVGDGIEFDPQQVESEKGVILGEFRLSRLENKSLFEQSYLNLIKSTPLEHADPLGTKQSIETATADGLKAYYQQWYQPQHVDLIIAGNIDAAITGQLITEHFSSWENQGDEPLVKQRVFNINTQLQLITVSSKESPSLNYFIARSSSASRTQQQLNQEWFDALSEQLINLRLMAAVNDSALSVQYARAYGELIHYQRYSAGGISFAPEHRLQVEALFLATLRSLRDHGVSQDELDAAMSYYRDSLGNFDTQWNKRKSAQIAQQKAHSIEHNFIVQGQEKQRDSLQKFIELATLKEVNQQLNQLLSSPIQWVIGQGEGEDPALLSSRLDALPTLYAKQGFKPVNTTTEVADLIQPGHKGELLSRTQHDGNLTVWTLSNGVEVWLQQDTKAGQRAHIVYVSQGGRAVLPQDLHPASMLLIDVGMRSGLGQLDGSQLDRLMRKHDSAIYPFIHPTSHGLEINAATEHLALVFNVMFNIATELNIKPRQLDAVKQEAKLRSYTYLNTPEGKFAKAQVDNIYLPESRYRFLTDNDFASVTVEQLQQVHHHLFSYQRGNKLVIIADMEPTQLAPLLRQYVASIDMTTSKTPLNLDNGFNTAAEPALALAEAHEDKVTVVQRIINTSPQPRTAKAVFADDMLQRISSARLYRHIREKHGFDYASKIFPVAADGETISDWMIEMNVASKNVAIVEKELEQFVAGLSTSLTQQEVTTAAKQLTLALEPLDIDPAQRAWFYSRYLVHGYGIDALLKLEETAQNISLDYMQQRALWTFGMGSFKATALLTPKQ